MAVIVKSAAERSLKLYTPHVVAFTDSNALCTKLRAERAAHDAAVRVLELQPEVVARGNLTLESMLLSTIQRLPRYTLLLREIQKHSRVLKLAKDAGVSVPSSVLCSSFQDIAPGTLDAIEKAMIAVRRVTTAVDNSVKTAELKKKASEIARKDLRRPDLISPARHFISERTGLKKIRKKNIGIGISRSARRTILFNDLLLVTREKTGKMKSALNRALTKARVFPLKKLTLIDEDLVYSPHTGTTKCWHLLPMDKAAKALFKGQKGQYFAALTPDDLKCSFIVGHADKPGKSTMVYCGSAEARSAIVTEILDAVKGANDMAAAVSDSPVIWVEKAFTPEIDAAIKTLHDAGIDVQKFTDPDSAVAFAQNNPVSAVVTYAVGDANPDAGIDLMDQLTTIGCEAPRIVHDPSACSDPDVVSRCNNRGATVADDLEHARDLVLGTCVPIWMLSCRFKIASALTRKMKSHQPCAVCRAVQNIQRGVRLGVRL